MTQGAALRIPVATPRMRDGDCDGNISTHSLSDADHSFLGENDADWAGIAIAGPGDVDGDGLADLLVGAAFQDEGGEDAGKAYLFLACALPHVCQLRQQDWIQSGAIADRHIGTRDGSTTDAQAHTAQNHRSRRLAVAIQRDCTFKHKVVSDGAS